MTQKVLRHGYTTGACAAAAAKGAAELLTGQRMVTETTIQLPTGASVTFPLHGQTFNDRQASCHVIKDAGDDPDITNGAEIHATLSFSSASTDIRIIGGTGIGKATKPGLAVAPGEYAINPVPRRMILQALRDVLPEGGLELTISIPDGELRALKTLNSRLGIIGGLSILGTTGIVKPVSAKAWTDTIDTALDVARAGSCPTVVFSTGRTSEQAAQKWLTSNGCNLPDEAFIMMGDHVAHAMRAAAEHGFTQPVIACQYAKLVKIACGHENTHAAASEMDLDRLHEWAVAESLPQEQLDIIAGANTAREIAVATDFDPKLTSLTAAKGYQALRTHSAAIEPLFLVADYNGAVFHTSINLLDTMQQMP